MNNISFQKNKIFIFFLISLFLFRMPNFQIFGGLMLHSVAALICIFVFIVIFFVFNNTYNNKKKHVEHTLILLLFLVQSISVTQSTNIIAFLLVYKNILISLIFYFLCCFYSNKNIKIFYVLILPILLNIAYQFVLIIFPYLAVNFYQNNLDSVLANLNRGRLYMQSYDEIYIPFLFLFISKKKYKRYHLLFFILIILIGTFSYISNFRSRVLMYLLSLLLSIILIYKQSFYKKIVIFLLFVSIGIFGFIISNHFFNYSLYDRFNDINKPEEVNSVEFRLNQIKTAYYIGTNKIFGVGLGNYYDFLTKKIDPSLSTSEKLIKIGSEEYVHNIFGSTMAETGIIGLSIFIILLAYFIRRDIQFIKKRDNIYKIAIIISFWSLFSYSLFNPAVSINYQIIFFGLRGLF